MEIRLISPEDGQTAMDIGCQAFQHGARRTYTPHPKEQDPSIYGTTHTDTFGVYDEDGMQAMVRVHHYKAHLANQEPVAMGGIAGVSCLPAKRGRNYIGTCLKYVLERMKENGQTHSSLYPFAQQFYRNYGWQWIGEKRTYIVPSSILQPDPHTEQVRAARPADREAIIACYTQYAQKYRGMLARNTKDWDTLLNPTESHHTYIYVYAPNNTIEGYIMYNGGGSTTHLREFICQNITAQKALLGLLRRMNMQIDTYRWNAPANDMLWWALQHNETKTEANPLIMWRLVDIAGAFARWRAEETINGTAVLRVHDSEAPWNNGIWRLEAEKGILSLEPARAEPDIELDIQALTQAFMGSPGAVAVRSAENIRVHSETAFAFFTSALNGPPAYISDSF